MFNQLTGVYATVSNHLGIKRLYSKRIMFRDGRARFFPISLPLSYTDTTNEFPFMLITHRLNEQFNTREMTLRSKITSKSGMRGFIAMNEQDASDYGLSNGSKIRINSPYGSVVNSVKIMKGLKVPKGIYLLQFIFINWEISMNLLVHFHLILELECPHLKKFL